VGPEEGWWDARLQVTKPCQQFAVQFGRGGDASAAMAQGRAEGPPQKQSPTGFK